VQWASIRANDDVGVLETPNPGGLAPPALRLISLRLQLQDEIALVSAGRSTRRERNSSLGPVSRCPTMQQTAAEAT